MAAKEDDSHISAKRAKSEKMPTETRSSKTASSKELLRLESDDISLPTLLLQSKQKYGEITRVPTSETLSRIKDFLPKMKAADEDLKTVLKTSPDSLNIENVEGADQVIQMDLAVVQYSDDSESEEDSSEDDAESNTNSKNTPNNLIEEV